MLPKTVLIILFFNHVTLSVPAEGVVRIKLDTYVYIK